MEARPSLELRRSTDNDREAVLSLLEASLGWVPDSLYAEFFRWKHSLNAYGPSPSWVALDGQRIVGFRTFVRWEFEREGTVVPAVRAVDTATHPDYQGQGIFSRLTLAALEDLAAEGVAFVFNTPNDASRPGYLKMGWRLVRRLPVLFRARPSPRSLLSLARARAPAEKWSVATPAGEPAAAVLVDDGALTALLGRVAPWPWLSTHRTPAYLRWRYGFEPLAYRTVLAGTSPADGLAVFRLRRRGPAVEAAVCEVLVPDGDGGTERALLRDVLRISGADYAVRIGGAHVSRHGYLPLPGNQGPTLVWRGLIEPAMPQAADWRLTLGDVELF